MNVTICIIPKLIETVKGIITYAINLKKEERRTRMGRKNRKSPVIGKNF